ncbi:MAG TPA: hypothetical protein VKH37_01290, partial [Ferruginibacter sp.]|nr:hypothetical protein [Ferruginibacter sp.]
MPNEHRIMASTAQHITEGVSRRERYPASLDPDHFHIDERTVDDLLLFMTELSFEYNYFNVNNKPDGNWLDFFLSDPHLMLRIFKQYDFKVFSMDYDRRKQQLAIAVDENELKNKLTELIEGVYGFLGFQSAMFQRFQNSISFNYSNEMERFETIVREDDEYTAARRTFYAITLELESA